MIEWKGKMPVGNQLIISKIYLFLIIATLIFLLYQLAPVLQPLYIAALLAYLSNPLVGRLERYKVPRILGVLIVFFFMLSIVTLLGLFLVPLLVDQINLLIHQLPVMLAWLQNTALPWFNSKFGNLIHINPQNLNVAVVEGLKTHQSIIPKIVATITSSGFMIFAIFFQLLLIPVVTFYLLRDWNKLIANIRHILPRRMEPTIVMLATKYNAVLRAFIRGQLLVIILLGFIYTLGLWIVGLQFAVLIGIIAGLLNIVPYLGFTTGLISALLAAYYQFQRFDYLIFVSIVFIVGQSIESMLLTPLLVGDSIGLHPVAVIFAVLTGGYFLGLIGALIALPVAAAIMVLMRFALTKYYQSSIYSL